jgi:type I restriction enzyme S subunit
MREDWVECKFEDITSNLKRGPFGGDLKKAFFVDSGYKVYEQQHAINNDFALGNYYIDEEKFQQLKACRVEPGDYIVSCSGTMGKIARIPKDSPLGIMNQALLKIKINDILINPAYFIQFFRSSIFQKVILKDSRGSGMQNMAGIKEIKPIKLFLPPLPIQRAIVSKIETLFSDLDNGIADLNLAKDQLKIYRQAVLKKAFEGELTKAWREKQSNLPTAEELLEQIKQERQKHYEQQVEDWQKAIKDWEEYGKEGRKPSKPQKLNIELKNTDTDLPEIPLLWSFINLDFAVYKLGDGLHGTPKYSDDGDCFFINGNNLNGKKIQIKSNTKRVDESEYLKHKRDLNNDTVFVSINGTIGNTSFYNNEKVILGKSACYFNLLSSFDKNYIRWRIDSLGFRNYATKNATGSTIKNVPLKAMREYVFPLCSKQEQHAIVREIESRLSVCDKVEQSISEALVKSEALRQSILKKAFEGKLLSEAEIERCKQEADYEPAGVLLERIKKEKASGK